MAGLWRGALSATDAGGVVTCEVGGLPNAGALPESTGCTSVGDARTYTRIPIAAAIAANGQMGQRLLLGAVAGAGPLIGLMVGSLSFASVSDCARMWSPACFVSPVGLRGPVLLSFAGLGIASASARFFRASSKRS